jgi:hypothetical protein
LRVRGSRSRSTLERSSPRRRRRARSRSALPGAFVRSFDVARRDGGSRLDFGRRLDRVWKTRDTAVVARDISRRPLPISEHLPPISVPRTRLCRSRSFRSFVEIATGEGI